MAIKERYHYITDKNLLPGWEHENRRLFLRGPSKKLTKWARMPNYDQEIKENHRRGERRTMSVFTYQQT